MPVWVDDWQYQCCGEPFKVGSPVEWTLTLDREDFIRRALGAQAPAWSVIVPVLAPAPGEEISSIIAGADGLRVFVAKDSGLVSPGGQASVRLGLLVEEHHGGVPEGLAPTRGRVRRIRLVRFGYERHAEDHAWHPRAGDAALQDMATAEKWPAEQVQGRCFAGFLVDLDVEDPTTGTPQASRQQ